MTVFRKSVSWSKFKMALECPLQLQKTIDKEYSSRFGTTSRAAASGKVVQKVFELYFNGSYNIQPNGQRPSVPLNILKKVMVSKWAVDEGVEQDQLEEIQEQVLNGYGVMSTMGILNKNVRSEVKMMVTYAGFRMFGMLDFLVKDGEGYLLFDGKGNKERTADLNQLLYYGLMVHSAESKPVTGGFIYWRHGYEPVDMSPKALYDFTKGEFAEGRKVFEQLKIGVEGELEAKPSPKACNFCNWKKVCKKSAYFKEAGEVLTGVQETGFK